MWNPQEIRNHAKDWSLEGDARILGFLKDFDRRLRDRTQEVKERLDELRHKTEVMGVKLGN